jgi:hypothetical protein
MAASQNIISPVISNQPKTIQTFIYLNAEGEPTYRKERVEPGRDGRSKEFYFKSFVNGRWVTKKTNPSVPYNLPDIKAATTVYFVEGEKKADLLKSWGLTATCLDTGAQSSWKNYYHDWFKDKTDIFILPDNDKPGLSYALNIAASLSGRVSTIKIVNLPGLSEKGDIIDWVKINGNDKEKLLKLVAETPAWIPDPRLLVDEKPLETFQQNGLNFQALPKFLQKLLHLMSVTTASPDEFLLTSILAPMSAAIGTRAKVIAGGLEAYPVIWAMLIGVSSDTFKSTAIKSPRKFIQRKDVEYEAEYIEELEQYKRDLQAYEESKNKKEEGIEKPEEPIKREIIFSEDETLESFYQTLFDNPDGGIKFHDELATWLTNFDKYTNGSGEKSRWLSIYDNAPLKYKRKSNKTNISISQPFVSMVGAITPKRFDSIFKDGSEDIESGFLPRFIYSINPPLIKPDNPFNMTILNKQDLDAACSLFERVMEMRPGTVYLSESALNAFDDWYQKHQAEKKELYFPEELGQFWRRIELDALKLALIFHQFKKAANEENTEYISLQTLKEALSLIEYYKEQAWALVDLLTKGSTAKTFDSIETILKKRGGSATTREITQSRSSWRGKTDVLHSVLRKMEKDGRLRLEEYKPRGWSSSEPCIRAFLITGLGSDSSDSHS